MRVICDDWYAVNDGFCTFLASFVLNIFMAIKHLHIHSVWKECCFSFLRGLKKHNFFLKNTKVTSHVFR